MTDHLRDATKKMDFISREDAVQCAVDVAADFFDDGSYDASAGANTVGVWLKNLPASDVRPVVQREAVMQALNKYFSIGDSYTYELNRVKEAFYVGTMTLDDFEEWNEYNVSDLCDYLMKEIFCPNCGADMREG